MLVSYMYVNYVDCGSKDQLKVNINVFDASGIFRDVYLALINRTGGLYGRILTEVVSTDRTQ